jgi:hypothetical protein
MKITEVLFFGAALLLPMAGGAVLLYVLSKGAKDPKDDGKDPPRRQ